MVVTKDLSRLGRDYIETGEYIEKWFPENNVRYVSVTDGIDTFDLSARTGKIYVNLSEKRAQIDTNSSGTFDIGDETDILNSIERVIGNSSDNTLFGDSFANILDGGTAGTNSLYGAGGNDTLIGSGTGIDIAYYKPASASIYVDMNQSAQVVRDGDGGSDILIDINGWKFYGLFIYHSFI